MFNEAIEKYGDKVQFVSITKDSEKHPDGLVNTKKYVAEEGLGWVFGEGQHVVEAYEVTKIPHTMFIDGNGFVAFTQAGFMEPDALDFQIQRMLGEGS